MKLIVWLVVSTTAWAGDFRSALKNYRDMERLDVAFQQTKTLKDIDVTIKSSGSLTVQMPDRVEWRILKPSPLTVEISKDHITMNDGAGRNRIAADSIPAAQRAQFFALFDWLRMDADAILQSYRVEKSAEGRFALVPLKPDAFLLGMNITLNTKGHVETMRLLEKSGDELLFEFGKPKIRYAKRQ